MDYIQYGKTAKKVSIVGFGGMRFDTGRPDEENAELVRYACSKGINYFDTAPGYCGDKSEDIFGLAFKDMPGEFYVSTKASPTDVGTAKQAREAIRKSLKRMGVEKIHFFHVWCLRKMAHYELAVRKGGLYDGLVKCKRDGLIEHVVFSSHQPGGEIKQILDSGRFEGVLLGVNILNFPYRWDGVKTAAQAGCGVVAMNPLAGGEIPRHEKQLQFLRSDGETPTEAALRFVISCPQITVALVGFTDRRHVDVACRVAEEARPFSSKDLKAIRKHLSESMDSICTGCGYCEGCPGNIPVASYMQFYNEKAMFGKTDEQMQKAVDFHHNWGLLVGRQAQADECTECAKCEEACTQHLDIIPRLKEIAAWEKASKA
ncbi:MAG: aldo/keto reductase [Planctomycetota bacterium]|jgi:predicted aldo/keto reductase-like oxidoreductase